MPKENFNYSSNSWYIQTQETWEKMHWGNFYEDHLPRGYIFKGIYESLCSCDRRFGASSTRAQNFRDSDTKVPKVWTDSSYIRQTRDEGRRNLSYALSKGFSISNAQTMA